MPKKIRTDSSWPAWFYGPDGEKRVCDKIQDVPNGWVRRRPQLFVQIEPLQVNEEAVRAKLAEQGIEIDQRWGLAHMQKIAND